MRSFLTILLTIFSSQALSDEPSVKRNCATNFKSYALDDKYGARLDTCPVDNNDLLIDIVSKGKYYHSCWWHVRAKRGENGFSANEYDCELKFEISGSELTAEFIGSCRSYCGARAKFRNGVYVEKPE